VEQASWEVTCVTAWSVPAQKSSAWLSMLLEGINLETADTNGSAIDGSVKHLFLKMFEDLHLSDTVA
jgi:hypothetical protein